MSILPSVNKQANEALYIVSKPNGIALQLIDLLIAKNVRVEVFAENVEEWESVLEHVKNKSRLGINTIDNLKKYDLSIKVLYFDESVYNQGNQKLESKFLSLLDEDMLENVYVVFNTSNLGRSIKEDDAIKGNSRVREIYVTDFFGSRMLTNESSRVMHLMLEGLFAHSITLPEMQFDLFPIPVSIVIEIIYGYILNPRHSSIHIKGDSVASNDFALTLMKTLDEVRVKEEKILVKKLPTLNSLVLSPKFDLPNELEKAVKWYEKAQGEVSVEKLKSFYKGTLYTPKPIIEKEKIINISKASKEKTKGAVFGLDAAIERIFKKTQEIPVFINKAKVKAEKVNAGIKKVKQNKVYQFLFNKYHIFYTKVFFMAFIVAFMPVILSALASGGMYLGVKAARHGNVSRSKDYFWLADKMAYFSEVNLYYYSQIPFVKRELTSYKEAVSTVRGLADIAYSASSAAGELNSLISKVLGQQSYDVNKFKEKLLVEIDSLYNKTSFLEGDIYFGGFGDIEESRSLLSRVNISRRRNELNKSRDLINNLDTILGSKGEKNYLLLFQNNMELRPTGGFIGSFAVTKFKDGRLVDISVMDVYSADGQLKGHVEPPYPIKKYLNEANWFLRDSNWDPNFPVSAERAQWFLSKEIEMNVDGVIAVDLNVVKDLLDIVGPVRINDFDKEVTSKNFYEVVQYEVEEGFFPGSRKKSNFLSALTKELIIRLSESKKLDSFMLARSIYENLEGKHIQIYFNDTNLQNVITTTGWAGETKVTPCDTENCFSDYVVINEANFGVNKANYFVERNVDIESYLDERVLRRKLTLTLKSNANVVLGDKGKYKAYVRIVVPGDSSIEEAKITSKGITESVNPEIDVDDNGKNAGVWVEIPPQVTSKITFTWVTPVYLDLLKAGEYKFKVYKQAGIDNLKGVMSITTPKGYGFKVNPEPQLTNTGLMRYNLDAYSDYEVRVSW